MMKGTVCAVESLDPPGGLLLFSPLLSVFSDVLGDCRMICRSSMASTPLIGSL